MELSYKVETFRTAGLEARWGKTRLGAPIIFARCPDAELMHQRENWFAVSAVMFQGMKARGVRSYFLDATLLGNIFSIPA